MKQTSKYQSFRSLRLHRKRYATHGRELTFWISLLIIALCTVIVSVALVPAAIFLTRGGVITVFSIVALLFGLLLRSIFQHMPEAQSHHHVSAILLLSALAVLNISIMITLSGTIAANLARSIAVEPIELGLLYGSVFLAPYLFQNMWNHHTAHSAKHL